MKRITTAVAVVLLALFVGCGKDNPAKPTLPGPKYLPSSTPFNVLDNLKVAYTTRDSTGYDSLFDVNYTGSSIDQTDASVLNFSRSDEARHINALARTRTISSIRLDLPPSMTRTRDAGDPPGWASVQPYGLVIEIDDGPMSMFLQTGTSETMEFRFAPTTPSPGSPTDTTWHIVRWTEIRS